MPCNMQILALAASSVFALSPAQATQNAPADTRSTSPVEMRIAGSGGPNGGMSVLHYEEFTLGSSAYSQALADIGAVVFFTSNPATFATQLQSGSYDAVISAHQNTFALSTFEDDLVNWAAANPGSPVLVTDWRINNPDTFAYLSSLGGFAPAGGTNPASMTPVAGGIFDGLGVASFASPGWGIYAYTTSGGTTEATSGGSGMVQSSGSAFYNGFLSDIFVSLALGSEYVQAELAGGAESIDCVCDAIYSVGDRVVRSADTGSGGPAVGTVGTAHSGTTAGTPIFLVAWDGFAGHNGNGFDQCPPNPTPGNGWYVNCDEVEFAPDSCEGDADGDGDVDVNDLLIVLGGWGCQVG